MTLLELIVALVVTGTAATIGYSAFGAVSDQHDRVSAALEQTVREAEIRATLAEWLRSAAVDEPHPFVGLDRRWGARDDDQLTFQTSGSARPYSEPGVLRLRIDRDPGTPEVGLVAERLDGRGRTTDRMEVIGTADRLQIRYLYGGREPRWVDGWVSSSVLPEGVELTAGSPTQETVAPLLRRPIRVAIVP